MHEMLDSKVASRGLALQGCAATIWSTAGCNTGMHLLTQRLYNHAVMGSSIQLHNEAPRCDKSSIFSRQAKPGVELLLNHRL